MIYKIILHTKKGDKKAAMREFKKRISSSSEILYVKEEKVWEGLSGHSRPTSRTQTSQINADLHPSGNPNVAQNGAEGKVQKHKKDASVSTKPEFSKSPVEKTEFGFTKDPYIALDALLRATGGKWKSNAKSIPVKEQTPPAVKGKKKEIDTDLPEKDVHPKVDSTESIDPSTINTGGMTDADIDAEIERQKAKLKEALNSSMHRLNANPIFDPAILVPAFSLGRLYIKKGTKNFKDFSKRLVTDIGNEVRLWCRAI